VTSKEAFEFIFGKYGINDAGYRIWEAAVKWERGECEDIAKRYKQRNVDNIARRVAGESIQKSIQRRNKNDRANGNV
jgi:hypothetical protein